MTADINELLEALNERPDRGAQPAGDGALPMTADPGGERSCACWRIEMCLFRDILAELDAERAAVRGLRRRLAAMRHCLAMARLSTFPTDVQRWLDLFDRVSASDPSDWAQDEPAWWAGRNKEDR